MRRAKAAMTGTANIDECEAVDTLRLQELLCCGYRTAVDIGTAAGARIQIGRRVLWNMRKVRRYLDAISE